MKKIWAVLAISFSALMTSSLSIAAPHDQDHGYDHPRNYNQGRKGRDFRNDDEDRMQNNRRMREERGVQRLQQHKWQTGYVMPQHYRGDGYKVDYKDYDLPKPSRNQQWYRINNDYILINSDNNSIQRILGL
ncbi:RcnB family protein [Acinetobacter sp.]|jgi:Ni/Co efflux regulator RcnB|uniref:RcnB family protein n=1 Tax=Acinetobacter sp. TaxID=472 RepID=UPI0035AF919B